MAYESVELNPGTGGAKAAVDTLPGGIVAQVVKIDVGADGTSSPVVGALPVSDGGGSLTVDDGGGSVTVDGTVSVAGTIPVSGPVTDAQLRATPLPVSDGGGSLTVDGTVTATGPLTDTQLRATAVPVSAAALPLPSGAATETTLAAANAKLPALVGGRVPVDGSGVTQPVSGTVAVSSTAAIADVTASGSLTGTGQAVTLALAGHGTAVFVISGTFVGTVTFEASNDGGATWVNVFAGRMDSVAGAQLGTSGTGTFAMRVGGYSHVRFRCSAFTSGTIAISGRATAASAPTSESVAVTGNSGAFGTGSTAIGKARAGVAGATDTGVAFLGVRTDAPASVDADGQWTPARFDPKGRLRGDVIFETAAATTGAITAAAQSVTMAVGDYATAAISVSGTHSGVAVSFLMSDDGGTTFYPVQAVRSDSNTVETVSGTLAANQARLWFVSVETATHLRVTSTAWASGSATVRMTANAAPVEPIIATTPPTDVTSGATNVGSLNATATLALPGARPTVAVQATGTWVGTLTFQGSADGGANYVSIAGVPVAGTSNAGTLTATANGLWLIPSAGLTHVRVQMTAYTSGTAVVTLNGSNAPAAFLGSGVSVASVDRISTSITPGISAANLGKQEDNVASNGDTGIAVWSVRRDTVTASPTSASGDYQEVVTGADGILGVRVVASSLTTGAPTRHRLPSAAATTNPTNVKASAGRLYEVVAKNVATNARFLKLYDKASAPTVGTDVPVLTETIPGGSATNPGVLRLQFHLMPQDFPTGLSYALTTGITDADTGALAAGDVQIEMRYL